jgi:hypothetical protein
MPRNHANERVCYPCQEGKHDDCDGSMFAEEEFMRVIPCECGKCIDEGLDMWEEDRRAEWWLEG